MEGARLLESVRFHDWPHHTMKFRHFQPKPTKNQKLQKSEVDSTDNPCLNVFPLTTWMNRTPQATATRPRTHRWSVLGQPLRRPGYAFTLIHFLVVIPTISIFPTLFLPPLTAPT